LEEGTAKRTLQTGVVAFLSMSAEPEEEALRDRLSASAEHAQFVLAAPTYTAAKNGQEARSRTASMAKRGPDLINLFAGGSQIACQLARSPDRS